MGYNIKRIKMRYEAIRKQRERISQEEAERIDVTLNALWDYRGDRAAFFRLGRSFMRKFR